MDEQNASLNLEHPMALAEEGNGAEIDESEEKDLPEYDEIFAPVVRHQSSLTVYVRSLDGINSERFGEYERKLKDIIPNFEVEMAGH